MEQYKKEFIDFMVECQVLKFGSFTLKSGRQSPFFMNAGAYKSDMGYIVESVKVLTPELRIITLENREMEFHYRSSFLQKHRDYICLEAVLRLQKGKREAIEEVIRERLRDLYV